MTGTATQGGLLKSYATGVIIKPVLPLLRVLGILITCLPAMSRYSRKRNSSHISAIERLWSRHTEGTRMTSYK